MRRFTFLFLCLGPLTLGCKNPDTGDTEDSSSGTGSTSTTTTTTGPDLTTSTSTSTTGEPQTTGSTTVEVTTSSTGPDMTTGLTTTTDSGGVNCVPLECEGMIYACGDCMDNDGDGKYDSADPECISPCDDKEDTFATGLPGDNMDPCKQDCFFDGNSGGGQGDCAWDLKCDPMSPGGDKCPYDPDFNNCPMEQSEECVTTCQVPNGCDCFGCCTVSVDGMAYDIYLGDPDCSLAEIDTCQQCTKNDDCDDECHPENCEVCFGETEPPPGCEDPMCDNADSCTIDDMGGSDCPEGFYCSTGCCVPVVPG